MIVVNTVKIREKLASLIDDDVLVFGNNEFYRLMSPYIPFNTGIMAGSVHIDKDGVHFLSVQAQYLYFGKLMVSPTTGSPWAEKNEKKVLTEIDLQYSKEKNPLAMSFWDRGVDRDELAKSVELFIVKEKMK